MKMVHHSELPESALQHIASKGLPFKFVNEEVHVPKWIIDLVHIEERRGTAGGTVDWHKVWTTLLHDDALSEHVHAAIDLAKETHGLTREIGDDIVIEYLRHITSDEPLPDVDFEKKKKAHHAELAHTKKKEAEDTVHHMALLEEQAQGAKKYSEAEMLKIVDIAVKTALAQKR